MLETSQIDSNQYHGAAIMTLRHYFYWKILFLPTNKAAVDMTGKDRCLLGILMTVAVVVSVDDSIAINSRSFHRKDVLATPVMEKWVARRFVWFGAAAKQRTN